MQPCNPNPLFLLCTIFQSVNAASNVSSRRGYHVYAQGHVYITSVKFIELQYNVFYISIANAVYGKICTSMYTYIHFSTHSHGNQNDGTGYTAAAFRELKATYNTNEVYIIKLLLSFITKQFHQEENLHNGDGIHLVYYELLPSSSDHVFIGSIHNFQGGNAYLGSMYKRDIWRKYSLIWF